MYNRGMDAVAEPPRVNRGFLDDPSKRSAGGSKKGRRQPPEYLRDLRYVYRNEREITGETQGQKILRKLLLEDPAKFLDRLQKAELDHRKTTLRPTPPEAETKGDVGPAAEAADEGAERCLGLIEGLLQAKEWAK